MLSKIIDMDNRSVCLPTIYIFRWEDSIWFNLAHFLHRNKIMFGDELYRSTASLTISTVSQQNELN